MKGEGAVKVININTVGITQWEGTLKQKLIVVLYSMDSKKFSVLLLNTHPSYNTHTHSQSGSLLMVQWM